MNKSSDIKLNSHFQQFVSSKVQSGQYVSTNEVINAALRLLEKEEKKYTLLNELLDEGLASGVSESFDRNAFLKNLKQ